MIQFIETIRQLQLFLQGDLSPQEFSEWISSAEGDTDRPEREQSRLGLLRLLLIEYGEGIRDLNDVERAASEMLTESGSSIFASSANGSPAFLNVNVTPEIASITITQNLVAAAPSS